MMSRKRFFLSVFVFCLRRIPTVVVHEKYIFGFEFKRRIIAPQLKVRRMWGDI